MKKIKKPCVVLTTVDTVNINSLLKLVHLVTSLDKLDSRACLFYTVPSTGVATHRTEDTMCNISRLYYDNILKGIIEPTDNYHLEVIDHTLSGKYKHKKSYYILNINKLTATDVCNIIFPAHDIWVEYRKHPYIITYKNATTDELGIYDMIRKVLTIYFSQDDAVNLISEYVNDIIDTLYNKNILKRKKV